jgi:hypothetical protein
VYEYDDLDAAEPAAVMETTRDTEDDKASHDSNKPSPNNPLTQGPQGEESEKRQPGAGGRAGEGEGEGVGVGMGEGMGAATGHFPAGEDDGWQVQRAEGAPAGGAGNAKEKVTREELEAMSPGQVCLWLERLGVAQEVLETVAREKVLNPKP